MATPEPAAQRPPSRRQRRGPLHAVEEHTPPFVGALFWVAIVFSVVPDRHGGVQPAVEFGRARGARRLPAARDLRAAPAAAREGAGLGGRRRRVRRGPVPLGQRGRPGAARRRPDARRHGGGRADHRAGVRGRAPHHGLRAAADLPDLPRLRPVRPVPARGAGAPRLRHRPDRRRSSASAPRASTARRPTCRRPTSSCSSCSAPSSNRPA